MSAKNEVTSTREAEIIRLIPLVTQRLDSLRDAARQTVQDGASLGAHLHGARPSHREDLWSWLRGLSPDVREDVLRFSLKSYLLMQRQPALEDSSQFHFAFAATESADARVGCGTAKSGKDASDGLEMAAMTALVMRVQSSLTRFKRDNDSRMDATMRDSLRELLRPIVELWQGLERQGID